MALHAPRHQNPQTCNHNHAKMSFVLGYNIFQPMHISCAQKMFEHRVDATMRLHHDIPTFMHMRAHTSI